MLMDDGSIRAGFSISYIRNFDKKPDCKTSATGPMCTAIAKRFYFVFEMLIKLESNSKRLLLLIVLYILNDNMLQIRSIINSLRFPNGISGEKYRKYDKLSKFRCQVIL